MGKIEWVKDANKHLAGRTIKTVRWLSKEEQDNLGWFDSAPVLVLDNGVQLYCSSDDEGNNAGALFTTIEELPTLPVGV